MSLTEEERAKPSLEMDLKKGQFKWGICLLKGGKKSC